MKTKYILLCLLSCATISASYAQIKTLINFNGTNGAQMTGAPLVTDTVVYGMTNTGGSSNTGVIFSVNTDGTGYSNLHNFVSSATGGRNPNGTLCQSGSVLYGMTSGNGAANPGNIFSINKDGTAYTDLYDFPNDSIHGMQPMGSLTLSNNILYGMTYTGGTGFRGTIFSIHTDGTGMTNLLQFTGPNGAYPVADLVLSGNTLYGMTSGGGANNAGTIFSIQTNGTGYTKIMDFNNANGSNPGGSLALSGNILYGFASGGGANNKGLLFSIHTDGSNFKDLLDFKTTNGSAPYATPILYHGMIYGTTNTGGASGNGTLFSVDTSGTGYQDLVDFSSTNGSNPLNSLALSGGTLYGGTVSGGTNGQGVLFSMKILPPAVPICMVTVDDLSKYNEVLWTKPTTTSIDSFIVYREITANNYKRLGAVPYSYSSVFIDTVRKKYAPYTGDPNAGTYRYKLQVRDTAGNYSLMSPYHNTVFVTQTGGTFNWNQYLIEGDSTPVPPLSSYVLYRDDNSTGIWHSVSGVSSTQTTLTDPAYSSYPHGSWRIEASWTGSCSSSTSKSNTTEPSLSGIKEDKMPALINLYPNPTNGVVTITVSNKSIKQLNIVVYNALGESVYNTIAGDMLSGKTLDLSFLPKGVYFMQMNSVADKSFRKVEKIVVQ